MEEESKCDKKSEKFTKGSESVCECQKECDEPIEFLSKKGKGKAEKKSDKNLYEHQIDGLQCELEASKASMLRLQADFENYKKRNKNIATEMYGEGVSETVEKFLSVLDNLDRAVEMASNDAEKSNVDIVRKLFIDILGKLGVEEIAADGELFDPNFHNAVMQVEDSEKSGKVVQTLQKGYKADKKVIRYSMVTVAN